MQTVSRGAVTLAPSAAAPQESIDPGLKAPTNTTGMPNELVQALSGYSDTNTGISSNYAAMLNAILGNNQKSNEDKLSDLINAVTQSKAQDTRNAAAQTPFKLIDALAGDYGLMGNLENKTGLRYNPTTGYTYEKSYAGAGALPGAIAGAPSGMDKANFYNALLFNTAGHQSGLWNYASTAIAQPGQKAQQQQTGWTSNPALNLMSTGI
jgi:hypothetical protein